MDDFVAKNGRLHAEDVPLSRIAEAVGTPAYVYSRATLVGHFRRLRDAFAELKPHVGYAVKANGNLAILRLLADRVAITNSRLEALWTCKTARLDSAIKTKRRRANSAP